MGLIQAVIILEHYGERFSGLYVGDAGAVNAIPSYRKLLSADIARNGAPHNVFRRVNFKLSQLYRHRANRRNLIFVSLVAQGGLPFLKASDKVCATD